MEPPAAKKGWRIFGLRRTPNFVESAARIEVLVQFWQGAVKGSELERLRYGARVMGPG